MLLLVLCFAEAGSLFDEPGGAIVYTRAAFGDFAGFEVGWMSWIARIASIAGLSVFFARAVGYLWPAAKSGLAQQATIVLPLLVLTWINVKGIKQGALTAVVLAWGKVLPLVLFVAVGLFWVDWGRVFPVPMPERANFMKAALLVLFAYGGFENTSAPAGEFKNPRRDVPFALIVQIAIVATIYSAVQLVAIGTMPNLGASPTPLADGAARMMGPAGGLILTIGAILSVLGTNNNTVLAGPAVSLRPGGDGKPPEILRPRASPLPHPARRDPDADGCRAPADADGDGGGARRALGDRAAGDVHGHRAFGAGSSPQDAADAARDPAAGRGHDPDRRLRHLPSLPLGRDEEELDRRRDRSRRRSRDLSFEAPSAAGRRCVLVAGRDYLYVVGPRI